MNEPADGTVLHLKDGRLLGYGEYGKPDGIPVVFFPGMPSTRLFAGLLHEPALAAGVRLISPDRPGYGLSEPSNRSTLLGYAEDILELADALRLDRFAVIGASGGGPYPLAFSYQHPGRVKLAGLISGLGPLDRPDSMRDMIGMNKLMFTLGRLSPGFAGWLLARLIRSSLRSMEQHVRNGTSPSPDLSPQQFAVIARDQREAVRMGGRGIAFDMKSLLRPWGFELKDVRTKVYLWHGAADNMAPAVLAHYIADHIPGAVAVFYPGEGHVDPLTKHIDEILAKIVEAGRLRDA